MERSTLEIKNRMMVLCGHMATGGKVKVIGTADNTIAGNKILAIYSDATLVLSDCRNKALPGLYGIFDIIIKL